MYTQKASYGAKILNKIISVGNFQDFGEISLSDWQKLITDFKPGVDDTKIRTLVKQLFDVDLNDDWKPLFKMISPVKYSLLIGKKANKIYFVNFEDKQCRKIVWFHHLGKDVMSYDEVCEQKLKIWSIPCNKSLLMRLLKLHLYVDFLIQKPCNVPLNVMSRYLKDVLAPPKDVSVLIHPDTSSHLHFEPNDRDSDGSDFDDDLERRVEFDVSSVAKDSIFWKSSSRNYLFMRAFNVENGGELLLRFGRKEQVLMAQFLYRGKPVSDMREVDLDSIQEFWEKMTPIMKKLEFLDGVLRTVAMNPLEKLNALHQVFGDLVESGIGFSIEGLKDYIMEVLDLPQYLSLSVDKCSSREKLMIIVSGFDSGFDVVVVFDSESRNVEVLFKYNDMVLKERERSIENLPLFWRKISLDVEMIVMDESTREVPRLENVLFEKAVSSIHDVLKFPIPPFDLIRQLHNRFFLPTKGYCVGGERVRMVLSEAMRLPNDLTLLLSRNIHKDCLGKVDSDSYVYDKYLLDNLMISNHHSLCIKIVGFSDDGEFWVRFDFESKKVEFKLRYGNEDIFDFKVIPFGDIEQFWKCINPMASQIKVVCSIWEDDNKQGGITHLLQLLRESLGCGITGSSSASSLDSKIMSI